MRSFCNKKHRLTAGRAAVGIYLALMQEGIRDKEVLVPANVCYAAVFPIILSGNRPLFCDVEPTSGNLSCAKVLDRITDDTAAVVLPHMYGNPIEDIEIIANNLRGRGIIVIEDCASALGATVNGRACGDFGDYSVFSFGHSKTLDLGGGGMLFSDKPLDKAKDIYSSLPLQSKQANDDCDFFSRLYRLIRNAGSTDWSKYIYRGLAQKAFDMFIYRISDETAQNIERCVADFESIVERRRLDAIKYGELIRYNDYMRPYSFGDGASPWRFNVLVEPSHRRRLIDHLLSNSVFVSDWYPCVTDIFFDGGSYPSAKYMEERILNFPLPCDEDTIKRICKTINNFFEV